MRSMGTETEPSDLRVLPSVPTPHLSLLPFIWSQYLLGTYCVDYTTGSSPLRMWTRTRTGASPQRDSNGTGGDCLQRKNVHRAEGTDARGPYRAARWSKGRGQGLTDDPWKETKPRSDMAPGPREAGRADAWQVRSLDSHLWHSRWLQPELQAFPSQIKINSEAIKMTTHALPAKPRTKVGSGSGLGRAWWQKEWKERRMNRLLCCATITVFGGK